MAADTHTELPPVGVKPAQEAIQGEGGQTPAAAPHSATTEHAGKGGLPQFRFEYWGGQIIWLLIIFAVLYALLAKVFVPRLRRVLDTRAETIAGALEQARRAQAEADTQAQAAQAEIDEGRAQARRVAADAKAKAGESLARSQARRVAADAKAKAQAEMAARQAEEDQRLAAELETAELRIRGLRDQAMASVGAIAAETAEAIVAKLTGASASRAEVEAALGGRTPEEVA
jgi:F-type H+-transporting ATPase subunit b